MGQDSIYCSNCGIKNDIVNKYCSNCGMKLVSDVIEEITQPVGDNMDEDIDNSFSDVHKTKPKILPVLLGIIIAISMLIVSIFIYNFITGTERNLVSGGFTKTNDEVKVEILPLNYLHRDYDDGWNIGFVRMYFLSSTEDAAESPNTYRVTIEGGTVNTAEGKTYPVDLYTFRRGDIDNYLSDPYIQNGGVEYVGYPKYIEIYPLISGLPMRPIQKGENYYVFLFKYAKAATPTTMVLQTSQGEVVFNLDDVEKELPDPNPILTTPGKLNDYFYERTDAYSFRFHDTCYYDSNGHYWIDYTITNNNDFDNLDFQIPGGYGLYYEKGRFSHSGEMLSVTVGPGQTKTDRFYFDHFAGDGPSFFVYINDGKISVFGLWCAKVD